MRLLRVLQHRLHSLLRRSAAESDLDRELSLHIEQLTRENMARGMSEPEARLEARREFGSLALTQEECRDTRRVNWIEDLWRDLAYAFRQLVKTPGFALTATLSLALGIGANTAIFSLADAVLLRMLPVAEPQQLVEVNRAGGSTLSYPLYRFIRDRNEVFSGALVMSGGQFAASLRHGATPLGDIRFSPVSADYFSVLGVDPTIGRALEEQDMATASAAVISHTLWQDRFHSDPAVLGQAVAVGEKTCTIVGVAPAGFTGVSAGQSVDLWLPITWFDRSYLENPVAFMFRVIARRKPGVAEKEAAANIQVLARQWAKSLGFEDPIRMEVNSASGGLNELRRRFSRPLRVLMTIVVLLLLCAIVNVANLLLVRATRREREMAIRLSIGAGRGRLIRQLLAESFLLAALGGALGLLMAPAAARSLVRFLSASMGELELPLAIDSRILLFTLATSAAAAILFGIAPALAATRLDRTSVFRGGVSARAASPRASRSGALLVIAQVAISCVLLSSAVLFARSLRTLVRLDTGFDRQNLLLLSIGASENGPRGVELDRLYGRVLDRLSAYPGVRSAAFSSETLFGGGAWTEAISAPGFAPAPGQNRESVMLVVSPGFFRTMGTRLLSGRDFDRRDGEQSPPVAIVNESMARYFLGDTHATGRTFQVSGFEKPLTVVGVVEDARYRSLREPAPPIVYIPSRQHPPGSVNLAVRTAGDPVKLADALWAEAQRESPALRYHGSTTQARQVNRTLAQDRMLAELSALFAIAGALLVSIGLFGLTAYEVSRRTAELGVRLALGARRAHVVRLVLSRALLLVGCGAAIGLAAATALLRLIRSLVFGVDSTEPVSLIAPVLLLLAVGIAAAYAPARRAASVDPVSALREQ